MPVLFSQAPNVVTSPQADFQVTDDLDIGDDAAIGGDLTVGATLAVTGTTTLTGAVSTVADLTVGDDIIVTDDASVGGDLGVTGALAVTGASVLTGLLTADGGIALNAGDDITIDGVGAGSKIGQAASKIGLFGATPVVQPTALTAQLTTITHTAPGAPDYALQDLVQNTGYGFVTKDEGNSTLAVIANLQARLASLETKLTALGVLHA